MGEPTFDSELLALRFVESLLLKRTEDALAVVASVKSHDELIQMFYVVSKILASDLEAHYSLTGALEKIDLWRRYFLNPAATAEELRRG